VSPFPSAVRHTFTFGKSRGSPTAQALFLGGRPSGLLDAWQVRTRFETIFVGLGIHGRRVAIMFGKAIGELFNQRATSGTGWLSLRDRYVLERILTATRHPR
jgi:hypothetical protein